MADFLHVGLGAAVRMFFECVQTQIDVRAMGILVAQPRLKLGAYDLPSGGDPLHCLSRFTIADNDCQPIGSFKISLDIASRHSLRLQGAFRAGSVGTGDRAVVRDPRINRRAFREIWPSKATPFLINESPNVDDRITIWIESLEVRRSEQTVFNILSWDASTQGPPNEAAIPLLAAVPLLRPDP